MKTGIDDEDLENGHLPPIPDVECQGRGTEHSEHIYRCTRCESYLCDQCWGQEPSHQRDKNSHEMSSLDDFVMVYDALHLERARNDDEIDEQKAENKEGRIRRHDAENMWFGVSGPQGMGSDYVLYEGIAYEDLMLSGPSCRPTTTFPSLVSFVGETGRLSAYLPSNGLIWTPLLILSRLW